MAKSTSQLCGGIVAYAAGTKFNKCTLAKGATTEQLQKALLDEYDVDEETAKDILEKLVLLRDSDRITICNTKNIKKALTNSLYSIVILHEIESDDELTLKYISTIKEIAVKDGYKKIQNTIYKVENENIISVDFLIVNSERLIYKITAKKQSFDEIFWKIMRMEENINERFSLRINGAFVAPTVLFYEGDMELSENLDLIAEEFLKKVNKEINLFLETNNLEEYIFSDNIVIDKNILRCLSYIDSGLLSEAKKLAEEQLLSGNTGRFVNEGRGFFELVLLYDC